MCRICCSKLRLVSSICVSYRDRPSFATLPPERHSLHSFGNFPYHPLSGLVRDFRGRLRFRARSGVVKGLRVRNRTACCRRAQQYSRNKRIASGVMSPAVSVVFVSLPPPPSPCPSPQNSWRVSGTCTGIPERVVT